MNKFEGHTPGPWRYNDNDALYDGVNSKDGWICTIGYDHAEYKKYGITEVQINAALIAAAPDLLKRVKVLEDALTDVRDEYAFHGEVNPETWVMVEQALKEWDF